ncbi:uncharacterized protein L203_106274 [Cryptococcus depauperatus CBS 7841]|uniref:Uncharacterized protein n=1 Tax=Cryptococcus depauperatus CBS 7841 TaxID=1295531 RepID=A0AAJ8JYW4_9TREE
MRPCPMSSISRRVPFTRSRLLVDETHCRQRLFSDLDASLTELDPLRKCRDENVYVQIWKRLSHRHGGGGPGRQGT